ncbi:methionine aminopeptidase, type II [Edhazardia aedis USNM 41457]|uniref:Methionine aminopeptidase 2 n=1 Tax=Edhazardia aedis (strain USNM 41457) TaxID=1003232 RepID=J9D5X9_EDHAE|nr:methionine aminopeptidase, type II [Edhazardia aedis USNM 41457]|eukprot:EJW02949.1 methionine aminopeptidase, type II [Edhazardia aedis USNM 41457]
MLLVNPVKELPIEFLSTENAKGPLYDFNNEKIENFTETDLLKEARRAAEAHRRSRYKAQQILKPGASLREVVETIENSTRAMLAGELNNGIGFPTGISLNSCAAHFTLNPGDDDIILGQDDVLKVDFGTHVNGRIMDSAFTVAFNPRYEPLLMASKEATEAGIKALGVDVRVHDIGAAIQDVMSGYEMEIDGKVLPIRPVQNLNGHSIEQFKIHAGISIPNVRNGDHTKIKEDSFYAIETFATTGRGYVRNAPNTSHYMGIYAGKSVKTAENKKILDLVKKNFKTLPFCPRYVDTFTEKGSGSLSAVRTLALLKHFEPYPPLNDTAGSYIAQFEHTIYVTEFGKEIITRGDDY